jgi:hypothetical protein
MAFTSQSLALRAPVSLPGGRLAPSAGRVALRGRDAAAAFPSVVVVAAAAPAAASAPMAGDEAEKKEVKLWGGRFEEGVTDAVERFTESISYDWQLYKYDIMGSKAHATMLASQVSTVPPCSPSADCSSCHFECQRLELNILLADHWGRSHRVRGNASLFVLLVV